MRQVALGLPALVLVLALLGPSEAPRAMHFRDVSASSGLTTAPKSRADRRYVLDTMAGGGVAFLDCDGDGRLDVAAVNDTTIEQYLAGGDPMLTLYRQDGRGGDLHFTDVTASAGLDTKGWGMGIAVGDFDNDGSPDLYVTGYGHNALYRNLGDCRFQDVTRKAGVLGGGFSTGAAWADYDRDGRLDLFVARYVHTDAAHLPDPGKAMGYKGVLIELPDRMEGEAGLLYHNRGDGTFEEVAAKAGVDNPGKLHGMGVAWGDYDGDGWPDLFVTNDGGWNFLYHNLKNGKFAELGIPSGTGLSPFGTTYGNMAADFGDFDRDGRLDLFVTRFGNQPASLYRNNGDQFSDLAQSSAIAVPSFAPVKWGANFGDFDNDGWPDIVMANGNFSSLMNAIPGEVPYAEPLDLFRNLGNGRFEEVAGPSGLNDGPLASRRGTAVGDVDNDGRLDLLVFNANAPPSLFRNDGPGRGHRILIRLVGTGSNRLAVGARVSVKTAAGSAIDEVRAGSSYNSSSDSRPHFGLGSDSLVKTLEVRWPNGMKQQFDSLPADALYEIVEGGAPRKAASLPAQAP